MYKIILIGCFFFSIVANGQIGERHFFDRNNELVDSLNSYYYTDGRVRMLETNTAFTDTLFSYYTHSGKLKEYQVYTGGITNGPFVSFYENGEPMQKGFCIKGKKSGEFTKWYPDGILQESVTYRENSKSDWPIMNTYADSLGNELVSNGNGFCNCYQLYFSGILREKGKIRDGLRDSVWVAYIDNVLAFREDYKKGQFLTGARITGTEEVTYRELEKQPEYPGGMKAMMNFFVQTMKYPKYARKNNIEGKVFVGFVIDKDGTVTQVKAIKKVEDSIDQEAVRVVSLMKKWNPGMQRGAPVRVRFALPVNFRLK